MAQKRTLLSKHLLPALAIYCAYNVYGSLQLDAQYRSGNEMYIAIGVFALLVYAYALWKDFKAKGK